MAATERSLEVKVISGSDKLFKASTVLFMYVEKGPIMLGDIPIEVFFKVRIRKTVCRLGPLWCS